MSAANVLGPQYERYYGKYRGKVLDNLDPLFLGRILANVAAVQGMRLNWCMPCVPYAGEGVGFYAIPPIDANVWIEFEGGDPNYPIWSGCFWGEDEVPTGAPGPPNPEVKVFKTQYATLVMNDTPEVGGITIECHAEAVATPLSIIFNSAGITISAEPAVIKMITEEGITLTYPPDTIAMTADTIEITVPPSAMTVTSEAIAIDSALDVNVAAAGAVSIEAGADASISSATILLDGVVSVEGGLLVDEMVPVLIPA
jgi:hypothetical protein